jgi:hypothetical protein
MNKRRRHKAKRRRALDLYIRKGLDQFKAWKRSRRDDQDSSLTAYYMQKYPDVAETD